MSHNANATAPFETQPSVSSTLPAGTTTCDLTRRHFVLQERRPSHLDDIELVEMDPTLRNLLFTDGTVTRTLEVQALSQVSVDVVAQSPAFASGSVASCLEVPDGMESIQRRVIIGTHGSPLPAIWAESYIVPSRLPTGFLGLLEDTPDGIGESLQRVKLESWREMLWFGLDSAPSWSELIPESEPTILTRLYRVIIQGRPALLIQESFAIAHRAGAYRLNLPS